MVWRDRALRLVAASREHRRRRVNGFSPQPGPQSDPANAPSLGGWRIIELIGRGGMGEVYRAEREGPGGVRRRAALKRILPALQADPALRGRFLSEARINARLEHPNVVQVLDYGDDPEPYLALEFVDGTSVARVLRRCAEQGLAVSPVAVAYIIAEAATGLDYAHRRLGDDGQPLQIVHRDVSPQNLLISVDGAVKVSDFGIARAADNQLRTAVGVTVGKIAYMSPEAAQGQPYDWRADVFALGVVLWETLLVRPLIPRSDPNKAVEVLFGGRFDAPSRVNPAVPAELDAIVLSALAVDPAQRTASAGLLAQQLRAFVHTAAPAFDGAELVRSLAPLSPEVRWQHSQRSERVRQATMPPPTAPAAPAVLAAMPGAIGPMSSPMSSPMAINNPVAGPIAPPSPLLQPGPPLGNALSQPLASNEYKAPPRPLYDAPSQSPVAAPTAPSQSHERRGLSTRAKTAMIVVAMLAIAIGTYAWLTVSNDAPQRQPIAPTTNITPTQPPVPAPLAPPAQVVVPPAQPSAPRDYTPEATAALSAVETTVQACIVRDGSAARSITAAVVFDNSTGLVRSPGVTLVGARGRSRRLSDCVSGALRGARFAVDPGSTGETTVNRTWSLPVRGRTSSGGGNSTVHFPFGVRH